jgi:hypothetical protein
MPGHAQERMDITQIFEQFVMAKTAAGPCDAQEADFDRSWSVNFMAAMLRTIQAVRERNPSIPESRIDAALQSRVRRLRASVESLIDREGCALPNSQELQRLYRVQASMRLF